MNKKGKDLYEKKYPKRIGVGVIAFIGATNLLILGWIYPVKNIAGVLGTIIFLYFLGFLLVFGRWTTPFRIHETGVEIPLNLINIHIRKINPFIPYSEITKIFPAKQIFSKGWNKDIFSQGAQGFIGMRTDLGLFTKDEIRHVIPLKEKERKDVLKILKNVYGEKWDKLYIKKDPYSDYSEEETDDE